MEKTTKRLVLDVEDAAASLVGRTLSSRYVLEEVLGQGGMGTVYAARHQVIGRRYAVKVLRREIAGDPETVLRFVQEAKIAGGLAHPNVVEVLDFGEVPAEGPKGPTAPFMVMPLLDGRTMAELLQADGPFDGARAARLFAQAADGLAAAHDKGVVHRDLKPDNLFVVREGGAEVVKVLDFGVAKLLRVPKLTRRGTVFGTPYYMSPEQAGGRDVDARTDQYALGVVMYEVLSGRVPFDDETPMGVMTKHLFATPEPLELAVRDHARLGSMGPIVMRCLEKRRESRFSDMRELAAVLRASIEGVAAPGPPSGPTSPVTSRGTVRLATAPADAAAASRPGDGAFAQTELVRRPLPATVRQLDAPPPEPRPRGRAGVVVAVGVGLAAVSAAAGLVYRARDGVTAEHAPSSATASSAPGATAPRASAEPAATPAWSATEASAPAAQASAAPSPSGSARSQLPLPARPTSTAVKLPATGAPTSADGIDRNVW